jgi:glutamine synthetase
MIALNTAVADQLTKFKIEVDALIEAGVKKDEAIFQVLKKLIIESKAIRFDGNGYSDEWKAEAAKRGLTNITSVPTALEALEDPRVIELYEKAGVLTHREIESRIEVELEKYTKKIQIEARVLGDLAMNHIIPTAINYQTSLLENMKNVKEVFGAEYMETVAEGRLELIKEIGGHISAIKTKVNDMVEARKVANVIESAKEKAVAYESQVRPYLDDIRYHIDKLELIVDNELWPLPKYRELLFVR